jgi:glycosyltransferase involved in cell wall biosynthesis
MKNLQIAYISFDIVPAPKGAATHIMAFVKTLSDVFPSVHLITVSPDAKSSVNQLFTNVIQVTLPAIGDNLISRVLHFQSQLSVWLKNKRYDIIHFRSIYEGFPIAINKKKFCNYLIFEVNGLPSIELKYRYSSVVDDLELLDKINQQEQICLELADLIITPSQITKNYLCNRGIADKKIKIIRNGVDLNIFTYSPPIVKTNSTFRILYFGTLSAWQGVDLAIEAMTLTNQELPTELIIIASGNQQQLNRLKQLASQLKVEKNLTILTSLSQLDLVQQIHQSHAIIVPLKPDDRNLIQGCCPLKILEGMATGIPVIASHLPVVKEIGEHLEHFFLVKPGSSKALKESMLTLNYNLDLVQNLSFKARQVIENNYTWQQSGAKLIEAYKTLIN